MPASDYEDDEIGIICPACDYESGKASAGFAGTYSSNVPVAGR
ncbi:hypothetical protein ABID26_004089 [Mesorhizobium shonense]|uniref:Uncharacterized protein n=1 Tax=Mesorhizobium shonense TaxID=1209948 RepID=A0ABV2HVP3_9HYPH